MNTYQMKNNHVFFDDKNYNLHDINKTCLFENILFSDVIFYQNSFKGG